MVGSNPQEWWIDTGATHYVCWDKRMFTTFESIANGEKVYMGNSTTSKVVSLGTVILKMTSEKELTLNNVLIMLKIQKNLVSSSLLSKYNFHMIF